MVQLRSETGHPAQSHVCGDELGPMGRIGIVGLYGRNGKAPDFASPWAIRMGLIDLVDSPIVGCARDKTFGIGKSGEAGHIKLCHLVAAVRLTSTFIDVVKIIT